MKKMFTKALSLCLSLLMVTSAVTVSPAFSVKADAAATYADSAAGTTGMTYYVDSEDGNDGNSGTEQDDAWQTLDKVNSTDFRPGDQILFKAGSVWNGELHITHSGSADAPIVFGKYGGGGALPRIDGGGGGDAINLDNASYITVENFEITNYNAEDPEDYKNGYYRRSGIWVRAYNHGPVSGIRILNNDIHDVTGISITGEKWVTDTDGDSVNKNFNAAIMLNQWQWDDPNYQDAYFNGTEVEGNNIHDVTTIGIYMGGYLDVSGMDGGQEAADSHLAKNVAIRDNNIDGTGDDGIVIASAYEPLIEYNTVAGCGVNGGDAAWVQWIAAVWFYNTYGGTIQYNDVSATTYRDKSSSDSAAFDVDIMTQGDFYIQYNYSHDNEGGFLMDTGSRKNGNTYVRYNLSVNDRHNGWTDTTLNIHDTGYHIYNNVFYNDTGEGFKINDAPGADFVNNIFDTTGETAFPRGMTFESNDFYGCDAPPQAVGSYSADPRFADSSAGADGFRLADDSPLFGQGIAIGDNGGTDFWGNELYTGTPEIGAFESPDNAASDTEAPAAAANLRVTGETDTTVSLAWNAFENGAPLSADVYDASTGAPVASSFMSSSCTVAGLTPSTQYSFYVVVKDKAGNASAPSDAVQVTTSIAAAVADDADAVKTGDWTTATAPDAYGGSYSLAPAGSGESAVAWQPDLLQGGYYAVSYWLPTGSGSMADNAKFTVSFDGGQKDYTVNERVTSGQWVPLGIHKFKAGRNALVTLTDDADGQVAADAVKFDYQSGLGLDAIVSAALSPAVAQAPVGGTVTLRVTGSDLNGRTLDLTEQGAQVSYQSDTPAVAAVRDGVVTGISEGTATVSATVTLNGQSLTTNGVKVFIGSAFTVCAPEYTDDEGDAVSALAPNGVVHVSDLIVNSTPGRRVVTFVAALYSANGMEAEKSVDIMVDAAGSAAPALQFILPNNTDGMYFKTFVLDSFASQHPLSDTAVFPAPADKAALNDAIAQAQALDLTKYTQGSADALNTALTAARAVAADANATQAAIDAAAQTLTAAIANLVAKTSAADKTTLEAAIAQAGAIDLSKYTDFSAIAVKTALAAAKFVDKNSKATQREIDAAAKALTAAISHLAAKPTVDKTRLEAAIAQAGAIDLSKYTDFSAITVKAALAAAKFVDKNSKATQREIDAAAKALDTAVKNLVLQPKTKPVFMSTR